MYTPGIVQGSGMTQQRDVLFSEEPRIIDLTAQRELAAALTNYIYTRKKKPVTIEAPLVEQEVALAPTMRPTTFDTLTNPSTNLAYSYSTQDKLFKLKETYDKLDQARREQLSGYERYLNELRDVTKTQSENLKRQIRSINETYTKKKEAEALRKKELQEAEVGLLSAGLQGIFGSKEHMQERMTAYNQYAKEFNDYLKVKASEMASKEYQDIIETIRNKYTELSAAKKANNTNEVDRLQKEIKSLSDRYEHFVAQKYNELYRQFGIKSSDVYRVGYQTPIERLFHKEKLIPDEKRIDMYRAGIFNKGGFLDEEKVRLKKERLALDIESERRKKRRQQMQEERMLQDRMIELNKLQLLNKKLQAETRKETNNEVKEILKIIRR